MLGTAVNLLPLHHPLRIAEEVATLDVLSGGRAVFGIGRGSNPNHYRGYGIPIEERNDRFIEGLDLALRAWKEDVNWTTTASTTRPRAYAWNPSPSSNPIRRCTSPPTGPTPFRWWAALGHSILVTPLIITVQGVSDGLAHYRDTLAEHGHDQSAVKVVVNVPVYVGRDCTKPPEPASPLR